MNIKWHVVFLFFSLISAHDTYLPINKQKEIAVQEPYMYASRIAHLLHFKLDNASSVVKKKKKRTYHIVGSSDDIMRHTSAYIAALDASYRKKTLNEEQCRYLSQMNVYDCSNDNGQIWISEFPRIDSFTERHIQDLINGNFVVIQHKMPKQRNLLANIPEIKTHLFIGINIKKPNSFWLHELERLNSL